jgi:hypothetical protein
MGSNWDATAMLLSQIEAEVLTLATDLMQQSSLIEWP